MKNYGDRNGCRDTAATNDKTTYHRVNDQQRNGLLFPQVSFVSNYIESRRLTGTSRKMCVRQSRGLVAGEARRRCSVRTHAVATIGHY